MRKLFAALMIAVMCLSLTACGVSLPDRFAQTTEPQSTAALIIAPSEAAVKNAFQKALEVYGWFDLCSLDCDSADTTEYGGHTYYRVISDEVPTYEALRGMVYDLFDADTGDRLLQGSDGVSPYIDVDGVLYTLDGARGSDITKGEYTVRVEQESKTSMLCKVQVETLEFNDGYKEYRRVIGYEEYTYHYQFVGNRWVFTDFELFY